jgi:lipid-binding SYLF domain-containing protein
MNAWKVLLTPLLALLVPLAGCAWEPMSYNDETAQHVASAEAAFRQDESLSPYFEQALAYAVFPGNWRAGAGFGAAFGNGWLFENGQVTGRALMTELFVGINLGLQGDRKILFFRTEDVLDQFKRGRFEFTGQANMAHVVGGKAATPSFNQDVAMFVHVRGGLLLEASVGTQRYDFFPLDQ